MKKLFSLLLIVMLASPVLAQYNTGGYSFDRSNLYYGIRIGFNSSSISSDSPLLDASSARVGVSLGGVLGLRLSESHPTFLESGLYYIQKGGKGKGYNVSLNYLEVPVLIIVVRPPAMVMRLSQLMPLAPSAAISMLMTPPLI